MYKYMYRLRELCKVRYFSAENPSLSATCGSYRYKKQLKRYFTHCYIEFSFLVAIYTLSFLMYRMRKYPNFLIRLLLTICIDKF